MSEARQLENERLILKVNDQGGQLSGIYDKKNEREIIWCADPKYWNRHAPILFPFVGEIFHKQYQYNGIKYPMTAHGFARDAEFLFEKDLDNKIVHTLVSTKETKQIYPFDFKLEVSHSLVDNKVIVEWKVVNMGEKEMLFSIGAHPAFCVPADESEEQKDYYLTFGQKDKLNYIQISQDGGCALYDKIHTLPLADGKHQIGEHLFDDGVLIFENHQLSEVGIAFPNKEQYVNIKCNGFPYVGIWTKPNTPFICLEPWYGRCDNEGFTGELKDKTGVQRLSPNEEFIVTYEIVVS
ncbi:aldose 1-epimerase family protein [Lachnotalea glycerini]|uniref:Aldose 1-epimerase family protein n=1 Tax=Lachnotalea glycerini TaxID=1763509 RepID=A0A371JDS7_9FIRM|nr:aldose 1-epimerase family protein [Lachnotalea glycerini]RDY30883.1 aldose 1-epimerase family protein [Lachnotalea glycerini]